VKAQLSNSRRNELKTAFVAFNHASLQLSDAFEALQSRVRQLTAELAEARAGRAHELALRQQLTATLERRQRMVSLGELAAALAHQIRTPLAAAMLYASQMSLPNRSVVDLTRCAERTNERLKELDKLINDMLAFARGNGVEEILSVSAVLEQVAQWLTPALERGAKLTLRTLAPELKIRGNAASLVGAVLNLATNALQAGDANVELQLLARRGAGGRAEILVADNGPGVPAAVREQIFEPFFTTRQGGTGLGLAIVRSVAQAHAGTVRLEPAQHPGACFVVDLPAEN
jgi:two-component system, sensor histidine kinase FlrB